ncbi:MAG: phosphatidate cytidylyltransferase [Sphingomonadaceae bacterium]|nr:phosphatidate cytidylyltransferase [Sphingomonadaceae bacterium]
MSLRVITGAVLIAVALAALFAGNESFWLLALIAAMMMAAEWAGLMLAPRRLIVVSMVAVGAVMITAMPWIDSVAENALIALVAATALVGLVGKSLRLALGQLYVGLPTLAILFIREQPDHGFALALWTFCVVWATDTAAFFAGRSIGGPKLAPRLSPKKTWSGLIGGIAGAMALGALVVVLTDLDPLLIPLGALLAVVAQAGDLFESWLKRKAGVKDSGRLLPGHGGALDRLDGFVPVATIVGGVVAVGWL